MRKYKIFIVLVIVIFSKTPAQNLISNGSFETMIFSNCLHDKNADPLGIIPPWFGQVYRIWNLECFWNGNGGCITAPKAGERYVSVNMSIGVNGISNFYLGIEFTQPLEAGKEYYFEMSFSDTNFLRHIPKPYWESLGAYFSQEPLDIKGWTYRSETPHIKNTIDPPYACEAWNSLSSCFVAEGGEKYVTLGFFNHPKETPEGQEALGGFVHLDDIKLIALEELENVLGPDREFCKNAEIALTMRIEQPGINSYLWQDGSTGPSLFVTEPGLYWVEVENECFSARDSVLIEQRDFTVDLGPDGLLCDETDEVVLQAPPDAENALWNGVFRQPTLSISAPGRYWLTADRNGCSASDTIVFYNNDQLELNLQRDTSLCHYDLPYALQVRGTANLNQVQWQDGTAGEIYPVTSAGTYRATVSNECGEQSREVSIEVEDCNCSLYMPSAFSPNRDGTNDLLQAYLECPHTQVTALQLTVFDRWGNQLFVSVSEKKGWDGTYRGQLMPNGVYIWQLIWEEALNDGIFQKRVEKGECYLLR